MKKLLFFALLIPSFSYGQRIDLSEQAGVSSTHDLIDNTKTIYGFSNQLSVGYHITGWWSVSAFYEFNSWTTSNNSFGLATDYVSRHFFAGIDAAMEKYASGFQFPIIYTYNTSWGYGLHVGSKQKIVKHLSLIEQLGFDQNQVSGTTSSNTGGPPNAYVLKFTEKFSNWYLRAGLSYRL